MLDGLIDELLIYLARRCLDALPYSSVTIEKALSWWAATPRTSLRSARQRYQIKLQSNGCCSIRACVSGEHREWRKAFARRRSTSRSRL